QAEHLPSRGGRGGRKLEVVGRGGGRASLLGRSADAPAIHGGDRVIIGRGGRQARVGEVGGGFAGFVRRGPFAARGRTAVGSITGYRPGRGVPGEVDFAAVAVHGGRVGRIQRQGVDADARKIGVAGQVVSLDVVIIPGGRSQTGVRIS